MTEKLNFVSGRVENIAVKGENAGYLHFLLFQQCFLKVFKGQYMFGLCDKEFKELTVNCLKTKSDVPYSPKKTPFLIVQLSLEKNS